ncbi:glycosyltransferase family 4 protein [Desulfofustis limnaeus]|uniref:glycosyltransferase family 4 protein n=1 Tax=Desulfofustis limnaeus TaxID=2740163 RepID=UPI0024DF878A|nr:glycosyltransferase family 4 protein [Desulfofustis limnaeus]
MITERYLPIWGGAENQLHQLTSRLSKAGCEVTILTRRFTPELRKEELIEGRFVKRVGFPGKGLIAEFFFVAGIMAFCFRNARSFDILHSHGALKMGAVVSFLALVLGKKSVVKIATAGHVARLFGAWYRPLALFLIRRIDVIIAISKEIEQEMRVIAVDPSRIVSIPNGVDCSRFAEMEAQHRLHTRYDMGFTPSDVLLLFVGRLVQRKGLDLVLQCWPRLSLRENLHLLIVGSGENQDDSIEQQARDLINRNSLRNIHFLGEVTNPEDYMPVTDIFLFPSRLEGFPNVLLEAMASGLPTVASAIGGTVDLIIDGQNGLLFDRDDSEQMLGKIEMLIEDADLRKRLGKNGRTSVRQNYAFETIAQQYLELYKRLQGQSVASQT